MLGRFISYYRYYKGLFALDMSVAVLASILSVIAPALVRDVLYTALPEGDWDMMVRMLSIILAIYILQAAATYIRIRWGHYLGVRMENQMRKELFSHLQTLSFSYFDKTKTGTIMSRITNDLFNIAEVAHHGPEDFLISIVTIVAAYSFMFSFSWQLSLVSIIPLPVMLLYGIHYNRKLKEKNRAIRKTIADVNVAAENSIQGIREVKSYSQEKFQEKKFGVSNTRLKESRESMYSTMANYQTGMSFMRDFYYFTTIAGGVLLIAAGQAAVYDLVTFVLYVSVVLPPIDRLINFTEQFTQGMASFERFAEILDIKPQIEDRPDAPDLAVTDGTVDFNHVSFSYEADDREIVIPDLTMHIPGGIKAALVGESGAGKSTIVSLLARFYERQGGSITIDGTDIDTVSQKSLHDSIGFVQQNVFLFDASIKENLRYGRSDATDEEMWQALRDANLYDFVASLPDGLNTEVGERGTRLSGGQKQRLSIARVFLKNPKILVFDEATSSLDTESETLIQDAFDRLAEGRTSIVIAHRLSTIRNSDIIFVIDKGTVKEQGTHDELISRHGLYYRLYSFKD